MDAPQTARRLGYPGTARLLIVNADDFGMCYSNNEATLRALTGGIVTSTTLMTPCPWASHAMQLLRDHPEIAFGVHLTLIAEHDHYRWRSLTPPDKVPSLIDEEGCFYKNSRSDLMLAKAVLAEVETEYRAQIAAVLNAGLAPTHLDFHCLSDGGRPDIFDVAFSLAKEFGLAVRVHDGDNAAKCRAEGLPTIDHGVLDSYSMPSEGKADQYAALLRALPPGLTEWAVHPGLGNGEARAMEPAGWPVRRADYDFVSSPEARSIIAEEGIVLLNYGALQTAWTPNA